MKKTLIFLLFLISVIAVGFSFEVNEVEAATYTQDAKGNWYWNYQSQLNESYYADLSGVTNKTQFESILHTIISTGYKEIGYDNRLPYLRQLDEDPNNSSNVLCLYTGISYSKNANGSSGTNEWNTEHTWAKSHGFSSKGLAPYSDLIHLRVTQAWINSSRSNSGFKEVSGGKTDGYGNEWSGNWFEPRDCVKGDVARIMMYMDVRYNGDTSSDGVNLTLVNGETSSDQPKFGDLDTLKKWHVQDPVDDLERKRNDVVFGIQGNRNPFVDHPEYANIIYGTNYVVEGGDTPTEPQPQITYNVSFNVRTDAIFSYTDNNDYYSGEKIATPTDPVLEGYTFDGWYKDSNYNTKWNFTTDTITKDITLYAKFTKISEPSISFVDVFNSLSIKSRLTFKVDYINGEMLLKEDSLYLNYVLPLTKEEYNAYDESKLTAYVDGDEVDVVIENDSNMYYLIIKISVSDYSKVYVPKFKYEFYELTLPGYSAQSLANYYINNLSSDILVSLYKPIIQMIGN